MDGGKPLQEPRRARPPAPPPGHIDGLKGGALHGWSSKTHVSLHLAGAPAPLLTLPCDVPRPDVAQAGKAPLLSGFRIKLTEGLLAKAQAADGWVEIRAERSLIGPFRLPLALPFHARDPLLALLRPRLLGAGQCVIDALAEGQDMAEAAPSPGPSALFEQHRDDLSPYLAFTRARLRKEKAFDPARIPADYDHLLHWYLSHYGRARVPLRVPLSQGDIAHLTAPVTIGGQPHRLSRGALSWVLARGETLNLSSHTAYLSHLFDWAWEGAAKLGIEDVGLTPTEIAALSAVPLEEKERAFPLTHFMARFAERDPALSKLDLSLALHREVLLLSLLTLAAAERPDLLRYVPIASLAVALNGTPSRMASFLSALTETETSFGPSDLHRLTARLGFDATARRFATTTQAGHRLHAPALTRPGGAPVDVQIVGPLDKASGLGQAARLGLKVLEKATDALSLSLNAVDFDLDNPAPEGFSPKARHSPYRRARFNLLHLNAESIPLAHAYVPNVWAGAQNAAHVYWELDLPADCHALGLSLIDELWVSSRFCADIYKSFAGPVSHVGMAVERHEIDPNAARKALRHRMGWGDESFIFLTTFDSLSFVQRKNPMGAIDAFRRAFPAATAPRMRLLLKTQNRDHVRDPAQARIWRQVEAALDADPRIALLSETLEEGELLRLKAGADAYVSLHRAEGWGFGMIEAMGLGVPVLATGYSGNLDFCDAETAWLVAHRLIPLAPDDYIFVPEGARWAAPDTQHAARLMRQMVAEPATRAARAKAAKARVARDFSISAIAARQTARLAQILETPHA